MKTPTAAGAALLSLVPSLAPLPAWAGNPQHLTEFGLCHVPPRTGICLCSLSSVETQMTFGEAANTVELFYRAFPDESYATLMISLLKQCSGELPSMPEARSMLPNMSTSRPPH
jgi:hypothetical protein